jgi:hypothetical protein
MLDAAPPVLNSPQWRTPEPEDESKTAPIRTLPPVNASTLADALNDYMLAEDRFRAMLEPRTESTVSAQAQHVEPVAWIQPDHLAHARKAPFLCRVEPKQRDDFIPIYTAPPPSAAEGKLAALQARVEVAEKVLHELIECVDTVMDICGDDGVRRDRWGSRNAKAWDAARAAMGADKGNKTCE